MAICVAQYDTMQVVRKVADMKIGSHTHTGVKERRKAYSVFALMRCANKSISNGFFCKQFFSLVGRLFIHFDVYVSVDPQDRVILFMYKELAQRYARHIRARSRIHTIALTLNTEHESL